MPLSAKQVQYLALAWQCFESEPKIDFEKFRTLAGLASPHSARELMRVTKKKLRDEYGALGAEMRGANANTVSASPSTANTTPKKRSKSAATAANGTPSKTSGARKNGAIPGSPKGKKRATSEEDGEGSDGHARANGNEDGSDTAPGEGEEGRVAKKAKVKLEEMQDDDAGGSDADADGELDDAGLFQM